jgi:hypothetical protein
MSDATDALRTSLSKLTIVDAMSAVGHATELRELVCGVVQELRRNGSDPEQVVLAIKEIAAEANPSLAGSPLLYEIVKWCVEEYFKP